IRDFHVTGVQTCALPILAEITKNHATIYDRSCSVITSRRANPQVPCKPNRPPLQEIAPGGTNQISQRNESTITRGTNQLSATSRSEERRVGNECRPKW